MLIKNKNSFILYISGLLVALILLNLTSRDIFHRFDLTDNKKFSLSASSEAILDKLDDRLTIKVYFSDELPGDLGNTRRFLQDILEEYRAESKEVSFFFHDPESDTDLEEQASKDGIQPVQMQALENDEMTVKKVYLGMVLLYENKKETIPLIQTTAGLEYMISTKIKTLIDIDKKTIGLMNLDKNSEIKTDNLRAQLNQHYNFRIIDPTANIPESIDVLLISAATDTVDTSTINNIRKYLDSGKKVFLAQSGVNADIKTQQANPLFSNIFDLLKDFRLDLQKNLVLDAKCGNVQVQEQRGIFLMNRPVQYPLFPTIDTFNGSDSLSGIVVNDLEQVLLLFPSEIKIDSIQNENVNSISTLFTSSNNSGIMESNLVLSPDPQQNPFIRMLGQPAKLLAATSRLNNGGELMLVSDSRFLTDEGGMSIPVNMIFMMNAVDYLANDADLIALRSREITSRPLDILQLSDEEEKSMSQDDKDKLKNSKKKRWKFANMVLPTLLIMGFGFYRIRREKIQAEVLKQIYD